MIEHLELFCFSDYFAASIENGDLISESEGCLGGAVIDGSNFMVRGISDVKEGLSSLERFDDRAANSMNVAILAGQHEFLSRMLCFFSDASKHKVVFIFEFHLKSEVKQLLLGLELVGDSEEIYLIHRFK